MKKLKKICFGVFIFFFIVWCGFWLYKQYALKDFYIDEALKTGKVINIRKHLYSVYTINRYPILLMSEDGGQTWYEKNFRGIWDPFPFLSEGERIFSVDVMGKNIDILYDNSCHGCDVYPAYRSSDEGKTWHILWFL